jgi:hypothetical protein
MEMNRRSFFGATAAAAFAGPSVVAEAVKPAAGKLASLAMSIDTKPLQEAMTGYSTVLGKARAFQFGGDRHYTYRTGYPAIDALRSISGVHKERMEKRLDR